VKQGSVIENHVARVRAARIVGELVYGCPTETFVEKDPLAFVCTRPIAVPCMLNGRMGSN